MDKYWSFKQTVLNFIVFIYYIINTISDKVRKGTHNG